MVARRIPSFGTSRMLQEDAASDSGASAGPAVGADLPETPAEWAETGGAVVALLLVVAAPTCDA